MLLYIAANNKTVSATIVVLQKEEGKDQPIQRPAYYVSEVFSISKQRYPHWQKFVLGVFMSSRKLKPYFQEHSITVVSSAPLRDIIQSKEATGRIAKWAIELGAYGIKYEPRTTIKSQALVDFINDWTELQIPHENPTTKSWTLHFDESRQLEGSEDGVVITSPKERNSAMSYNYDSLAPTMRPSILTARDFHPN